MSEEDINFLISIQDLEQPEFDNACLERENERLRNQLQQKENIIKEVREHIKSTINRWEDYEQYYEVVEEDKYILEILGR